MLNNVFKHEQGYNLQTRKEKHLHVYMLELLVTLHYRKISAETLQNWIAVVLFWLHAPLITSVACIVCRLLLLCGIVLDTRLCHNVHVGNH